VPRKPKAKKEFKLEDHLVLAQTIASKLGIEDLDRITQFAGQDPEGYEDDDRSRMHHLLLRKPGQWKLPEPLLQKYEDNIEKHLKRLRKTRGQDFNLKYFQYLAVIFAEVYLDHYFRDPKEFIKTLNMWNKNRGSKESIPRRIINPPKLAYWMATGSGKTLIMHLNLLQFLEYNKGPHRLNYDNIILVTSDDNMSRQHRDEFHRSGIPADLFDGTTGGYFHTDKNKVKIISIHKLKLPGDKKGEGVTIDVSAFGTKNLVFIDEGHKGQKSEDAKWKTVREKLAEDGFIWEYSATFGQTITSRNSTYFDEYKYSILFDYSYKYFHQDGYGKDFSILNLSTSKFKDQHVPILLLANTLDYYEQLQVYKNTPGIGEYQLENPLWIFLGSKVKTENSDILEVIQFLDHLFKADRNSIIQQIEKIIVDGKAGILGPDDRDVFTHHYPEKNFAYLREQIEKRHITPEDIYQGVLTQVFHIPSGSTGQKLELHDLKNAEGEIGLKASNSEQFFGVINIGDKSGFLELVRKNNPNIRIREAVFKSSLFNTIDRRDSTINLLLGAKKFIEGWNSYRVSNMCLLNIGKREGPQIIQLFGRGVRLKGKNTSLKRSRYIPGPHPKHIEILETLKIYGIQANYLQNFKEYIDKENIPTWDLIIPTVKLEPFPEKLYTITLEEGWNFKQTLFKFNHEEFLEYPKIDLRPKVQQIDSTAEENLSPVTEPKEMVISQEVLDLLDWNEIYYEMLEYKHVRGITNIHLDKESLRHIIENKRYKLYCREEDINPRRFTDLERIKEIVVTILKKCVNQYYKRIRLANEMEHIQLTPITVEDEKLLDKYEIKIRTKKEDIVKLIEEQAKTITEKQYQKRLTEMYLVNAYYQKHLYQPLLVKPKTEIITMTPTGLNEGENKFVVDLQNYLTEKQVPDKEIYLLRNLTRGRGVGFFEENRFYPDFIMWLRDQESQKIVFIDPKGIAHLNKDHPKLNLHKYLRDRVQQKITEPGVKLDAYILSVTPFDQAYRTLGERKRQESFAEENHLIFMYETGSRPNEEYIETLFTKVLTD